SPPPMRKPHRSQGPGPVRKRSMSGRSSCCSLLCNEDTTVHSDRSIRVDSTGAAAVQQDRPDDRPGNEKGPLRGLFVVQRDAQTWEALAAATSLMDSLMRPRLSTSSTSTSTIWPS